MLKLSWKEKQTNDNVLQLVEEKRSLVDTISRRKKNWLGHIMRGEGLLRNVTEGKLEGKTSRGRKCIMVREEFMKGTTFETLKRRSQERYIWRSWTPWTCQLTEY